MEYELVNLRRDIIRNKRFNSYDHRKKLRMTLLVKALITIQKIRNR